MTGNTPNGNTPAGDDSADHSSAGNFLNFVNTFGAQDDAESIARHLAQMSKLGIPAELFETFLSQLGRFLENTADAERVVVNLSRFLENSRSPMAWLSLFEREPDSLEVLVQLFATSQYMADQLIGTPESFDLLRMTGGSPVSKQILQDELFSEIDNAADTRSAMRTLREYRHRETLRIAYGDFVAAQPVDVVTQQISQLCEVVISAALRAAMKELSSRSPAPVHADGSPHRFSVFALGKLGGSELNYSSDIDLVFIYEPSYASESTQRNPKSAASNSASVEEYFQRLGQRLIRFLGESTEAGIAYRVDMRLRPYGQQGKLVFSYDEALNYYDSMGRTWERQAFIKARVVAGDESLGNDLLQRLQPWIYRRYLMRADITGIAAMKRRLERRSQEASSEIRDVKHGYGGIRDIEYIAQFLQLLHGGDQPSIRCVNTLSALRSLEKAGCITNQEQILLEENYCFLRQIEHFSQIMFDRQTHSLPADTDELRKFVRRIRYSSKQSTNELDAFQTELADRTQANRKVLEHLLHNAFEDESVAAPETDLLLDPEPKSETIDEVLAPYGFSNPQTAYNHLQELAVETIPFLSTRRCRHFLAAIAPKLLKAISQTPHPDATLIGLANVSGSIGGKAVLWELFSFNTATMELCLRLCAGSPYLASILTSNPGMIDELLDSLMTDRLPTLDELHSELDELCRGADDIGPILQSFKNSMHLRVGARNILGKDAIVRTHGALSDIAEACLSQVIQHEFHRLVRQVGIPMREQTTNSADNTTTPLGSAELVVLAVGKLGAREPNYHSDIDLIFLFDGDGQTQSLVPDRRFRSTTNRHFFNQLCQRVIHAVTRVGASGRLYDVDVRLRPMGRSGELAITIDDLKEYFDSGTGQLWERQTLTKARPVWGSANAQSVAMACVHSIASHQHPPATIAQEVQKQRHLLEDGATHRNLKRGVGGAMDAEFTVQLFQLIYAHSHPKVLVPGTIDAIEVLLEEQLISSEIAQTLTQNYSFLRMVESGIRLMNMSARHELPKTEFELETLAFLLSPQQQEQTLNAETPTAAILEQRCEEVQRSSRSIFQSTVGQFLPADATYEDTQEA